MTIGLEEALRRHKNDEMAINYQSLVVQLAAAVGD